MLSQDKRNLLIQRRREEILDAAKLVFARNGYRRTLTDTIIAELGVGKGTLYKYFRNKKTLFLAVFYRGMQQLREVIRVKIEPITDPRQKIINGVRTYFEFFDNDKELIEIIMQVRSEFKDEYRQNFLEMYNDYIGQIQQNLKNGIALGQFREVDIEKTADAISDILQGTLQSYYILKANEKLADKTQAVTALLLKGVLKISNEASAQSRELQI
ncbi:MAG: TetR/AcrR family transcriptional regulator [Sedimentisphaerales bacterium]|nr:TetR/AcrR family transcriptional regulator [Sedimentisphaerales bacterium]